MSSRKNWKIQSLFSSNKKNKFKGLIKREKIPKAYLTNCNLLMVQDLWQAPCQILFIILLEEFIKLNVNSNLVDNLARRIDKIK